MISGQHSPTSRCPLNVHLRLAPCQSKPLIYKLRLLKLQALFASLHGKNMAALILDQLQLTYSTREQTWSIFERTQICYKSYNCVSYPKSVKQGEMMHKTFEPPLQNYRWVVKMHHSIIGNALLLQHTVFIYYHIIQPNIYKYIGIMYSPMQNKLSMHARYHIHTQ